MPSSVSARSAIPDTPEGLLVRHEHYGNWIPDMFYPSITTQAAWAQELVILFPSHCNSSSCVWQSLLSKLLSPSRHILNSISSSLLSFDSLSYYFLMLSHFCRPRLPFLCCFFFVPSFSLYTCCPPIICKVHTLPLHCVFKEPGINFSGTSWQMDMCFRIHRVKYRRWTHFGSLSHD